MRSGALTVLRNDLTPLTDAITGDEVSEDITQYPVVTFGSYYRLDVIVEDTNGIDGRSYVFNPAGISRSVGILPLISDTGFKISFPIIGSASVNMLSPTGVDITTITNLKVTAYYLDANKFYFHFDFYAGEEFSLFMSTAVRQNKEVLLSTRVYSNTTLDNSIVSAWNNDHAFIQYTLYNIEDNEFAVCPDTNNSNYAYYQVITKYIDSDFNNNNLWSGSNYAFNALEELQINYGSAVGVYASRRKPAPFYSLNTDSNFESIGTQSNAYIRLGNVDELKLNIRTPDFTPSVAIIRCIRVDDGAFTNTDLFVNEYNLRTAAIPGYIAPPFQNPAGITTSGGITVVSVNINGAFFQPNAKYRFFVYLHDTEYFKYQSVHVTPEFSTIDINPPTITASIITDTYNARFNNASPLNVSAMDRYKATLKLDASTYSRGLANFASEFVGVEITRRLIGSTEVSAYNFATNSSTTDPVITMTNSGNEYYFSVEYSPKSLIANATIEYKAIFAIPLANGSIWDIALKLPNQTIVGKPINDGYIKSLTFLDYNTNQPISLICTDESPYVWLRAEQTIPEAANVIVNIVMGFSSAGINPTITEEESYASSYLSMASSPHVQSVPAQFDANGIAMILLNTSMFPSNTSIVYAFVTAMPV
jgi:hypothetical protein